MSRFRIRNSEHLSPGVGEERRMAPKATSKCGEQWLTTLMPRLTSRSPEAHQT